MSLSKPYYRPAPPIALAVAPFVTLETPGELEDRTQLQQVAIAAAEQYRPENSTKIYHRVWSEWNVFCSHIARTAIGSQSYTTHLTSAKVYSFMFYQTFRSQKRRGGRGGTSIGNGFDPIDYEHVVSSYRNVFSSLANGEAATVPMPESPLGNSTIAQYRAALKKLHGWQLARGETNIGWEFVWTDSVKALVQIVNTRRQRQKRENYEEKVDKIFGPYQAVDRLPDIEQAMWEKSSLNSRSACCWLRHRFVFLYSTAGLLRCESLYKAELSDFLALTVKKETDVHPLTLMITQIPEGKKCRHITSEIVFSEAITLHYREDKSRSNIVRPCHEA